MHGYLRYRNGQALDLSLHVGFVGGDGTLHVHMGDLYLRSAYNYTIMGQAALALDESLRLKAQLYYDRNTGDFLWRTGFRAFDIWIADFGDFFWDSPTFDGQAQLEWQPVDNLLVIGGANLRYTWLETPDLTITDDDELRSAAFVHLQWNPLALVQLTGGLRFDYNSDTEAALSPRAAVVFRPWSDHTFRLGYGLAFRKPSHYESRWHPKIEAYNSAVPEIVQKAADTISNEDLVNEKVHSFEAGWRARFLDDRLNVTVDLFYNLYRDAISFVIEMENRMGMPDILNSTLQFENAGAEVNALGGEIELSWRPLPSWSFWANLGARRVTDKKSGARTPSEPVVRTNLGARFLPGSGPYADLAMHYVSEYQMPLKDPSNLFNPPVPMTLGNKLLVIARLGYRLSPAENRALEIGLTLRAPIGGAYREYSGAPMPSILHASTSQDFGGEVLTRLVTFFVRGSF
jgi:outer membrane receptor protein involved in Fe transport